jgi:ATP/maltotriose-dependent transcriptional regulator MalT
MASDTPDISPWLFGSLLAKAHVEAGRFDEATEKLEEFAAAGYDMQLDQVWLTGMVDFAEAAIECGDVRFAQALLERLAPFAEQLPATGASVLAPVSMYLGGLATVLGRYDAADEYLTQSAGMSARLGAKFFAARTDLLRGRMLVARGARADAAQARELLTRARDAAVRHKYGNVQRLAEEEVDRLPA